uniref:Uncharacterized protein n=1 Tax=Callorhinchus milii TaxID=7868 RepID=A0A4W3JTS3_CALMI
MQMKLSQKAVLCRIQEIFSQNDPVPASRILTFVRKGPFELEASFKDSKSFSQPEKNIGHFVILVPQAKNENSIVKIKVIIDTDGIFSVSNAFIVEEHTEDTSVEKESNFSPSISIESSTPGTSDSGSIESKSSLDSIEYIALVQIAKLKQQSEPEVETEHHHIACKKKAGQVSVSKNPNPLPVEVNLVWQINEDLLEVYFKKEDRIKMLGYLNQIEEWLYEEGENVAKQVYLDKLLELKALAQHSLRYSL